jgi:SAM-dependent methyltransferase
MANNLYGYTDYNGPIENVVTSNDDDGDDETDPLRAGLWMEGDSLAPPCGTSISTIHRLLEFGDIDPTDVVYDLGCGDGRVCLEALVRCNVKASVGVDIECDLVQRFQELIKGLPETITKDKILVVQGDLRDVISSFVARVLGDTCPTFSDLPFPTAVVLYLLPESIQELEQDLLFLLSKLEPIKIICNTWGFGTVQPTKVLEIEEVSGGATTKLFLYTKNSLQ